MRGHEEIEHSKIESNKGKNRKEEERKQKGKCECIIGVKKRESKNEVDCKRTVEYRCCPSRDCLPIAKRKRRIWLPAQVTRIVLRSLKSYVNNTFYGQSCECNNAVHVICANKDVC